jgi:hypothetical protein
MKLIVRTQDAWNELENSLLNSLWKIIFKNSFTTLNKIDDEYVCKSDVMTLEVNFSKNFHTEANQMVKIIHKNFVDLK